MRHSPIAVAVVLATLASLDVVHAGQLPAGVRIGAAPIPPTRVDPGPVRQPPPPPHTPRTVAPPIAFPFPGTPFPLIGGRSSRDFRFSPHFRNGIGYGDGSAFGGFGYGFAPFYAGDPNATNAPAPPPQQPRVTGLLRLAVTPESAQVFVDSFYVGTAADIEAQRALALDAGPHRLEMRAAGYETLTVDVRVAPYETITYRGALDPARAPAAQSARAAAPSSNPMYVIPNCYLGNVPPRANRLPSGCDIKNVQVLDRK
jgi:hypothetical protein